MQNEDSRSTVAQASLTLLGVTVTPLTQMELNRVVAAAVERRARWVIANHNLHSVYIYHQDPRMRAFYRRARLVHIDGMSLVLWARLLGYPLRAEHRVTYVDWIGSLMEMACSRGWRVFYLGGRPGVAERAAALLRSRYPGLRLAVQHGYFPLHGRENAAVLDTLAAYRPHVLLVGMGMPRQEYWILEHMDRLPAHAILTAGACFDYVAGVVPTPPRWLGRIGLEWAYRLVTEPRRLWRRYLWEPWFLMPHVLADLANRRQAGVRVEPGE